MKKLAIALWLATVLSAYAMLIAALVDIESIIVTGPLLTLSGFALAIASGQLRSWTVLTCSLSGPLLCIVCAALIAGFRLMPPVAQRPITGVIFVGTLLMAPMAIVSWKKILKWQVEPLPLKSGTWQFSLKTLILLMTGLCLVLTVGRYLWPAVLFGHPEWPMFWLYAATMLLLGSLVVWRAIVRWR